MAWTMRFFYYTIELAFLLALVFKQTIDKYERFL